ncbi:Uncharacterised protein [Staphylococcus agnetis]|uniref:epilancin biosynthesis-related protein ElxI1 n=1 Tax=Staphylococcus agnetis TaxID=985762 RepID=UPI000DFC9601|nr:Uncharacterised protein [Staphylococcus agnetis]
MIIKILDFISKICFVILGSKFVIQSINVVFDLNLRWYFFETIPHLSIILFILILVCFVSSEMLKEKNS